MKNIKICTWHYFQNHGSQLQCLALFNFVKQSCFNVNVKVVDYKSPKFCKSNFIEKIKKHYIFFAFICFFCKKNKTSKFNSFYRKNLKLTKCYYGINGDDVIPDTDLVIFGSDQIWSPNVFDPFYFGENFNINTTKISYGSSVVVKQEYSKSNLLFIKNCFKSFKDISFREPIKNSLKDLLEIKKYDVVCDPTLLFDSNFYNKFISKRFEKKYCSKPYILEYFLSDNINFLNMVDELCCDKTILSISSSNNRRKNVIPLFEKTGPEEFLALVKNADFIYTDSFHGVCFALIYKINFYVIERFSDSDELNQNLRVLHLLEKFGLENRIVPYDNPVCNACESIDFDKAFKKAKKFIQNSKNYLLRNIKNECIK